MNTYLAIMTTVFVLTQVIRIVRYTISLFGQERELKKHIGRIKDTELSREDFEVQRETMRLLRDRLKEDEE